MVLRICCGGLFRELCPRASSPFKVVGFFLCCRIEKKGMGWFSEKTAHNSLFELNLRWGRVPISKQPKTENLGREVPLSSDESATYWILCGERDGRLFFPHPSNWGGLRGKRMKNRYRDGDCTKTKNGGVLMKNQRNSFMLNMLQFPYLSWLDMIMTDKANSDFFAIKREENRVFWTGIEWSRDFYISDYEKLETRTFLHESCVSSVSVPVIRFNYVCCRIHAIREIGRDAEGV